MLVSRQHASLPPSPPLPRPAQAVLQWKLPLAFADWCRERLGDRYTVYTPPMGDVVYTAVPEDIKALYTGDQSKIHAGEAYDRIFGRLMGPNSLFVIDDEKHIRLRRMTLPAFHGESVRRFRELFAEAAAEEVDRWPVGGRVRLIDAMQRLTLEVIVRSVFGTRDPIRLAELRTQLPRVIDPGLLIQLGWVIKPLERFGPWQRHQRFVEEVQQTVVDEMPIRRADPDLEERTDVFSMFLAARDQDGNPMTDEEVLDEIMTMFVAGVEATSCTLAWAFERIMRHPSVLGRLLEELREGDETYLDAVVKEAQRVYPAVVSTPRVLVEDMDIGDHRIPAGTVVAPSMAAIQRSPKYFHDPLEFRPERWLDGSTPYTWFPFGGGVRRCLGSSFATAEVKTTIATVLRRVELVAPTQEPEGVRTKHITVVPSRGAEAIVRRRLVPLNAPYDALEMQAGAIDDVDPAVPARA